MTFNATINGQPAVVEIPESEFAAMALRVEQFGERLTMEQVATLVGKSVRTVSTWMSQRKIEYTKVGGKRLVERAEVNRLLRGERKRAFRGGL